jgi:Flp pilus assembly pilin Flp
MNTMLMTVDYVTAQVRRIGRRFVRNDAGALTLEWLLIGVALVAAAGIATVYFTNVVKSTETGLK